jgi:hypothetical protein
MKTTLQMEFLLCQLTGRLVSGLRPTAMPKFLALLLLWEAIRAAVEIQTHPMGKLLALLLL